MRRLVRWSLGGALVLLIAVPVAGRAMREERNAKEMIARVEAMQAELEPLARRGATGRRVIVNGSPVFFRVSTFKGSVTGALDQIRKECESGDQGTMLGGAPERTGDGRTSADVALRFMRAERQQQGGVGASLCIFHDELARDGSGTVTRYALARRVSDDTASVFSVASEQSTPYDVLFPDQGDAPGGDFDGVPRPRDSRRVLAATLEGDPYAVRIYESKAALPDAVASYDADMKAQGWSSSEAVAKARPDARVYRRGAVEMVASFRVADGVTAVAIAPLM
jgi:hypothetical protein